MPKWKATEGVRRLSLALGLLFAVPWSVLMGGTCISEYLQFKPAWEQANLEWEQQYGDLDNSILTLETKLARINSFLRKKGLPTYERLGKSDYEWEDEILRLRDRIATLRAYATGKKKMPSRPTLGDFYKALVALALSPVVFGIPWGAVRSAAWVIEGFRERGHST